MNSPSKHHALAKAQVAKEQVVQASVGASGVEASAGAGSPDLPTLRSLRGTKYPYPRLVYAQLAYFEFACGLVVRMRSILGEIREEDWAHLDNTLGNAGRAIFFTCARCGASERLDLPKPVRCMLTPSGVPAGLGDQIWDWMRPRWSAHLRCPGMGAEAVAVATEGMAAGATAQAVPEISDVE